MIDNFDKINKLLKFDSEDDFYHLQILKRRKENPEIRNNAYVVKTYYVTSNEYLLNKKNEIIELCTTFNARACINLNRRSFEKIAFQMLRKVTEQIMNKQFKHTRKAYESVCGANPSESDKKWIIDVDYKSMEIVKAISDLANKCRPKRHKVIDYLKTKNGFHIITSGFDVKEFKDALSGYTWKVEIQKDNPTILYV